MFSPPYPARFLWGGKTSGGGKHSASGFRGQKIFFARGALRKKERKKETKKGIRLSYFFGWAQVKKNSGNENDDAVADAVNARNGFQA